MSVACTVIDIVRADPRADEFLEEVVFLIGASRGGEPADGIGAVLLLDGTQLLGNKAERLVPGSGNKRTVLLDERRREPVGAVNETVSVPPLDAEPSFVDRVRPRGDAHHFVPAHMQCEVAPASAVGADGLDSSHVLLSSLAHGLLADKSSGGADADALAAELAVQVLPEGRRYLGGEPSPRNIDRAETLDLIAHAHTLAAEDTLLHVPFDKRVQIFLRIQAALSGKAIRTDVVEIRQLLERAITGPLAAHAVVRVVGEQKFDNGAALTFDQLVRGLDLHSLGHRRRARGHRPGHALCLDEAEPASAVGL